MAYQSAHEIMHHYMGVDKFHPFIEVLCVAASFEVLHRLNMVAYAHKVVRLDPAFEFKHSYLDILTTCDIKPVHLMGGQKYSPKYWETFLPGIVYKTCRWTHTEYSSLRSSLYM